jgi:hypothetical protein
MGVLGSSFKPGWMLAGTTRRGRRLPRRPEQAVSVSAHARGTHTGLGI